MDRLKYFWSSPLLSSAPPAPISRMINSNTTHVTHFSQISLHKGYLWHCQKNICQTEYRSVTTNIASVSVSKIISPEHNSINQDLSQKNFYLIATVTTNCSSQLSGSLRNHSKVWGYPGGLNISECQRRVDIWLSQCIQHL